MSSERSQRPKLWDDRRISAVKNAYLNGDASTTEIAANFGTSRGAILRLAKEQGWPSRDLAKQSVRRMQ